VCDVDNEARQSNKCEGIANPGGKIKALNNEEECESYKYLGVLEADDIKHKEIKEKIRKEYFRRVKMILNSELNWGGGGGGGGGFFFLEGPKKIIESASKCIYQYLTRNLMGGGYRVLLSGKTIK
jgi:hypothetical protein